jgi:predicted nucleotidyltransferase
MGHFRAKASSVCAGGSILLTIGEARDINSRSATGYGFMNTFEKLEKNGIVFNYNDVVILCQKYQINELSVFGSSLRDDFNNNSDIDILVSFNIGSGITLFDIIELEKEFSELLNRDVDVVEKEALKNPIRRKKILSTREIIYAA